MANACKDHIYMLVSIPPKLSVSQFIGYLKGKSSLMVSAKYCYVTHELRLHQNDRCKRFTLF